jgi:S1-C subfamily serine protease
LTNWHLVKDQKEVNVRFKAKLYDTITKRSARKAVVISTDKEKDLALLELGQDTSVLPFSFRDSTDIADQGLEVYTIGHPYGLNWSFNSGTISAKRPNWLWDYKNTSHKAKLLYQTQIPIDKGNSGGPLLDDNGNVLGIVTYFHPQNKSINFSVSSNDIQNFLAKKIELYSRNKSEKVKSRNFDSNEDGVPDGKVLDTDNNGTFETRMVFDPENKSTIYTTDKNGNGIVEVKQVITQSEKYKKTAIVYFDLDDDGDWDKLIIDYGYDGIIDIEEKI